MTDFDSRPSRRRATAINFMTQSIAFAFVITQGILLVPAYLHYLGTAVYGGWLACSQIFAWLTLLDPGTDTVVRQRCAHAYGSNELAHVGELIGSGLAVNALSAVIVFLLASALAPMLPSHFGQRGAAADEVRRGLQVLALASATTIAAYATGSPILALQRATVHGAVFIGGTVAGITATITFLMLGWGVSSIPGGLLVRSVFWLLGWGGALLWLCLGKQRILLSFSISQAKELLQLSAFTFLSKLAYSLQTSADSVLIGTTLGPSETTKYVLTGRVIDAVQTFPDRLGNAIQPSMAHLFGEADSVKIRDISLRFIRLIGIISAFLGSSEEIVGGIGFRQLAK